MNRDRMLGPDVDEAGSEAPRDHGIERRRPRLGEAVDPDDVGTAAPDRVGELERRRAGPLHAGDAGNGAELLDRIEPNAVVA